MVESVYCLVGPSSFLYSFRDFSFICWNAKRKTIFRKKVFSIDKVQILLLECWQILLELLLKEKVNNLKSC